jgi:hypothetical protein
MPIIAILYTGKGGGKGSSHSIYKAKEVGPKCTKGVSTWNARWSVHEMQGGNFASEPGGIVKVTVWLCVPLLVGL